MNPDRETASTACSIVGGFYEVIQVKSVFEGGKFTQDLSASKMHHLNFVENSVSISSNGQVSAELPRNGTGVPFNSSQPIGT